MAKSLAVKYRPKNWSEVVDQPAIISILQEQIASNAQRHAYLFVGPAGCGKTTCARIFARELNSGVGNVIEVDAASNSGVENVRNMVEDSKRKPIAGTFKVFILDECHSFSSGAWQAFLKLLEEPPASAVFIFCTTDPQKIPATILSRVQRYDFSKMRTESIYTRLAEIVKAENGDPENKGIYYNPDKEALDYISKLAEGGMRDAITMLDKCLSFSHDLTLIDCLQVLGVSSYDTFFQLLTDLLNHNAEAIAVVDQIYHEGKDLKQFMRHFQFFVLDVAKYKVFNSFALVQIPQFPQYEEVMQSESMTDIMSLLQWAQELNNEIRWDPNPRAVIGTAIMLYVAKGEEQ